MVGGGGVADIEMVLVAVAECATEEEATFEAVCPKPLWARARQSKLIFANFSIEPQY